LLNHRANHLCLDCRLARNGILQKAVPGKIMPKSKKPVKSKSNQAHAKGRRRENKPAPSSPLTRAFFPIVGVGASAGGLAALTGLLKALPANSGLGFVLIQHLDPQHPSALSQLLSKATSMPVLEVTDGVAVQPDHVYVIPPNKSMIVRSGVLKLTPREHTAAPHHPIDEFYSALAQEQRSAAVGVILSGSGSDGTLGLKEIKAEGGVTFAQDPKTAEWPAMPMSAIAAGAVDFILPPKRIAAELVRIGRHPYLLEHRDALEGDGLERIYQLLRSATGADFRWYKQPTVRRRVARRMAVGKITSLARYAQFLKRNPAELDALAEDIFIHVTGFFRDPECFQALRKQVFPKLRSKRAADDSIRIWVPGCSTGEEVYSIAISLLEDLGAHATRTRIQMFGTDISERCIERARSGIYSEAAVHGVSAARLKRFFVRADHGYQINQEVRDLCVFARHDLASDPPFSKLDLISCRNVLIYMGPALQKKVLGVFQYALKPGGTLLLGKSEAISAYSDIFSAEDHRHKIFSRKPGSAMGPHFDWLGSEHREQRPGLPKSTLPILAVDFQKEAEQVLLRRYVPPALVVDSDLRVVHFQGDTGPYLALSTGPPTFHLFKMVRPEFVVAIRGAIAKAKRDGLTASTEVIHFEHSGQSSTVRMDVTELRRPTGRKPDFLIVFKETPQEELSVPDPHGKVRQQKKDSQLERELISMREHMRSLIAEHQAVQEEMKAASEEALSSNEELQSTNEELETAKEELQSSNEELITLNEELRHRNAELSILSNDLNNLLVGVHIPVLLLDGSLHIRRFTPVAGKLLNLIESDVGRPFSDIASTLNVPDWDSWFAEVTNQVHPVEREVRDRNGYWYSLRLRPYRSSDNKIDGVIVVLLDIDLIKRPLLEEARESRDYASVLLEASGQAVIAVGSDQRIVLVNGGAEKMFGYRRDEMVGQPLGFLLSEKFRKRAAEDLRNFFVAPANRPVGLGPSLDARRKDGALFPIEVSLSMIERAEQKLAVVFASDVTERRRLETQSDLFRTEIGALAAQLITAQEEERRRVSRELHDGLCQQLASLALDVEGLAAAATTPAATRTRLRTLQARVIKTSEEARHIAYELHPSVLDDLGLAVSLKALCEEFSDAEKIPVKFAAGKLPDLVPQEVASGLYRIAQESLQNIAKHAKAKHVSVELAAPDRAIRLSLQDDGVGFDQLAVRGKGGLGMVSMGERARMMGARLSIESRPGNGVQIAILVPLQPADV
jgi:two-component system, chemotaxis family, CheB/CheR fusion protein